MTTNEILLVCAALFPAIALCIYIYIKDRAEKEPIGLLLLLLCLGAVICFPAAEIETALFSLLDKIFTPFATEYQGQLYLSGFSYKLYNACKNFIGIAMVEEVLKFLVLILVTRKSKHFNSLFDGVIYAVFVSLGFAALENVLYVMQFGWEVAVMRALLSVPGHMFFGVLMGYYYSFWNIFSKARRFEEKFENAHAIPVSAYPFRSAKYIVLSIVMPILAHGFYDYCCTAGSTLSMIVLFVFVLFLYIYCFGRVRKLSRSDNNDQTLALAMVLNKYPYLIERFKQAQINK